MDSNILEIKNIEKSFGTRKALQNVTLELSPGIYGLLGPNGAGKSTLINILSAVLQQDAGQVLFNGADIRNLGDRYLAHLGILPQQQNMYPFFTGYEFLEYMAAMKGITKKDAPKLLLSSLEKVGLSEYGNVKIGAYSGGMKQRLLLAQALLNDPTILILDEPSAGLDPKQRIMLRNLISEVALDKIVLLATHIVSDVEAIAKEVFLLGDGKMIDRGSVVSLCARVRGRVVEMKADKEAISHCARYGRIVSFFPHGDSYRVRVLLDEAVSMPDSVELIQVEPSLEEVYLDCFRI